MPSIKPAITDVPVTVLRPSKPNIKGLLADPDFQNRLNETEQLQLLQKMLERDPDVSQHLRPEERQQLALHILQYSKPLGTIPAAGMGSLRTTPAWLGPAQDVTSFTGMMAGSSLGNAVPFVGPVLSPLGAGAGNYGADVLNRKFQNMAGLPTEPFPSKSEAEQDVGTGIVSDLAGRYAMSSFGKGLLGTRDAEIAYKARTDQIRTAVKMARDQAARKQFIAAARVRPNVVAKLAEEEAQHRVGSAMPYPRNAYDQFKTSPPDTTLNQGISGLRNRIISDPQGVIDRIYNTHYPKVLTGGEVNSLERLTMQADATAQPVLQDINARVAASTHTDISIQELLDSLADIRKRRLAAQNLSPSGEAAIRAVEQRMSEIADQYLSQADRDEIKFRLTQQAQNSRILPYSFIRDLENANSLADQIDVIFRNPQAAEALASFANQGQRDLLRDMLIAKAYKVATGPTGRIELGRLAKFLNEYQDVARTLGLPDMRQWIDTDARVQYYENLIQRDPRAAMEFTQGMRDALARTKAPDQAGFETYERQMLRLSPDEAAFKEFGRHNFVNYMQRRLMSYFLLTGLGWYEKEITPFMAVEAGLAAADYARWQYLRSPANAKWYWDWAKPGTGFGPVNRIGPFTIRQAGYQLGRALAFSGGEYAQHRLFTPVQNQQDTEQDLMKKFSPSANPGETTYPSPAGTETR